MPTKMTRFERGNNAGTAVCRCCNKRTWKGRAERQCDMCETCYNSAGVANEHSDDGVGYDGIEHSYSDKSECPTCSNVKCMHELVAK